MLNQKSPRTMIFDEIKRKAHLNKTPDTGTYKPSFSLTDQRTTGCFNFKSDRNGYVDEAGVIGMEQPSYKDKNFSQCEPRVKLVKMMKPKEKTDRKRENLSPTSYDPQDSFKST